MIPNELKQYLTAGNPCSLLDGYIRLLESEDRKLYTNAAKKILEAQGSMEVFARTAFGDLLAWDGAYVYMFRLAEGGVQVILSGFAFFFQNIEDLEYQNDFFDLPLFETAQKKVGILQDTECYSFEPVPLLGGDRGADTIRKTQAEAYIRFLAGLY